MSNNRKQSTRKSNASSSSNKPSDKTKASEADKLKDDIKNVQASLKTPAADDKEKSKQTNGENVTKNATTPSQTTSTSKPAAKVSGTPADKPATSTSSSVADKETTTKRATDTATAQKNNDAKIKNSVADKNAPTQPAKTTAPASKAPEPKKSGKGGVLLALLLGAAGTGLGAYTFKEVNALKSGSSGNELPAKVEALTTQIGQFDQKKMATLSEQMTALTKKNEQLSASFEQFNSRISTLEQQQAGLQKHLEGVVDQKVTAVDELIKQMQSQVSNVELGQQGLTKNLSEVTAASEMATNKGIVKQEVSYLLRMAQYKLTAEQDAVGASGLLQMAADRLLSANEGKTDASIDLIRSKLVQLQGVKPVDTDALISQLASVTQLIPKLVEKAPEQNTGAGKEKASDSAPAEESTVDQIFSVIASGVEYTPSDPSRIDISAETLLIEKRLMQADVRTAQLAVRSNNKVLLAESIHSVREGLSKYFAPDETAIAIDKALQHVEGGHLDTVLPDLTVLINKFEQAQ